MFASSKPKKPKISRKIEEVITINLDENEIKEALTEVARKILGVEFLDPDKICIHVSDGMGTGDYGDDEPMNATVIITEITRK